MFEGASFQFIKPQGGFSLRLPNGCSVIERALLPLGTGEFPLLCGICFMALEQWTELSLPAVRHLAWIPPLLFAAVVLMFLLCVPNWIGIYIPLCSALAGFARPTPAQTVLLLTQWACPLGAFLPLGEWPSLSSDSESSQSCSLTLFHSFTSGGTCSQRVDREAWMKCLLNHWKVLPGPKYLIYWPCCGAWIF